MGLTGKNVSPDIGMKKMYIIAGVLVALGALVIGISLYNSKEDDTGELKPIDLSSDEIIRELNETGDKEPTAAPTTVLEPSASITQEPVKPTENPIMEQLKGDRITDPSIGDMGTYYYTTNETRDVWEKGEYERNLLDTIQPIAKRYNVSPYIIFAIAINNSESGITEAAKYNNLTLMRSEGEGDGIFLSLRFKNVYGKAVETEGRYKTYSSTEECIEDMARQLVAWGITGNTKPKYEDFTTISENSELFCDQEYLSIYEKCYEWYRAREGDTDEIAVRERVVAVDDEELARKVDGEFHDSSWHNTYKYSDVFDELTYTIGWDDPNKEIMGSVLSKNERKVYYFRPTEKERVITVTLPNTPNNTYAMELYCDGGEFPNWWLDVDKK